MLIILFSRTSEMVQRPVYLSAGSINGDCEVHQAVMGVDLNKAACVRGTFSLVYDWDFEGSVHLFPLSGRKMNCQLLQTCSDMTLHMVDACSALLYAGPPTTKPSVLKKGCAGKEETRGGSILDLFLSCALRQAVGRRSVRLTFVSPAELLNKMK